MVFLGDLLKVPNQCGMLPCLHKKSRWYLLRTIINFIGASSIAIHTGYYVYSKFNENTTQSMTALSLCITVTMHIIKIVAFLFNNNGFVVLYL